MWVLNYHQLGISFMKFLCRDLELATTIHEGLSFEVSSKVQTPRLPLTFGLTGDESWMIDSGLVSKFPSYYSPSVRIPIARKHPFPSIRGQARTSTRKCDKRVPAGGGIGDLHLILGIRSVGVF